MVTISVSDVENNLKLKKNMNFRIVTQVSVWDREWEVTSDAPQDAAVPHYLRELGLWARSDPRVRTGPIIPSVVALSPFFL
jgi:hypothetical protein